MWLRCWRMYVAQPRIAYFVLFVWWSEKRWITDAAPRNKPASMVFWSIVHRWRNVWKIGRCQLLWIYPALTHSVGWSSERHNFDNHDSSWQYLGRLRWPVVRMRLYDEGLFGQKFVQHLLSRLNWWWRGTRVTWLWAWYSGTSATSATIPFVGSCGYDSMFWKGDCGVSKHLGEFSSSVSVAVVISNARHWR